MNQAVSSCGAGSGSVWIEAGSPSKLVEIMSNRTTGNVCSLTVHGMHAACTRWQHAWQRCTSNEKP